MIFFILGLGLVLRLISLNQSLWLDEATTALAARLSLTNLFTKLLPGDFHPPFYYLIMKFWAGIFGFSEISLRTPSIIFGLGTIYFTFLIGKKLFNDKVGLIASALLATSGLSVYYSQEARMYSLAAFLVSASIYFFLEKKWIIFSLILALIGMTDYVSLFIVPVYFIVGWKYWKKIILSLIPLLAAFLVWLPIFIKQITGGLSLQGSNWWNILGAPTLKNLALIPVKFVFGRISFDNKVLYLGIGVVASFIFGFLLFKSRNTSKVLWAWLIGPILLGLIVSFKIPSLIYFRYLFCLTPFYLLLAQGLMKAGKFSKVLLIFLIAFNIATSAYYLFTPKFQREDWRGLVRFVESEKTVSSITIFAADSNMEAYRYYHPDGKIAGPAGLRIGYDQVWLMRYLKDVFDPQDETRIRIENLGYKKVGEYDFNGVVVWKYIK